MCIEGLTQHSKNAVKFLSAAAKKPTRRGIYAIRNKCFLSSCAEWLSVPVVPIEWAAECCVRPSHVAMRGLKNFEITSVCMYGGPSGI